MHKNIRRLPPRQATTRSTRRLDRNASLIIADFAERGTNGVGWDQTYYIIIATSFFRS